MHHVAAGAGRRDGPFGRLGDVGRVAQNVLNRRLHGADDVSGLLYLARLPLRGAGNASHGLLQLGQGLHRLVRRTALLDRARCHLFNGRRQLLRRTGRLIGRLAQLVTAASELVAGSYHFRHDPAQLLNHAVEYRGHLAEFVVPPHRQGLDVQVSLRHAQGSLGQGAHGPRDLGRHRHDDHEGRNEAHGKQTRGNGPHLG